MPYVLENKIKQKMISHARRVWSWSPERKTALALAEYHKSYQCAGCLNYFPRKEVQVDHLEECVCPKKGWQGFDIYLERLFCGVDGLQVLCKKKCHKEKTTSANSLRRQAKKQRT